MFGGAESLLCGCDLKKSVKSTGGSNSKSHTCVDLGLMGRMGQRKEKKGGRKEETEGINFKYSKIVDL